MPTQTIGSLTIHYRQSNAPAGRPPLVLLHGFPLDSRIWEHQVAGLGAGLRVIAPDLRGFGQSHNSEPFTIESLGDDIHQCLSAIGALPCILGGLSMGGYVALGYARKYPGDLAGLVLVDTRAEADTAEGKEARGKMIELVRREGSRAVSEQMLPKMLAPRHLQARPDLVAAMRQIMESCPPLTIEHALDAMRRREDYRALLPSISVPTLIIVGDSDAITPPAMAQAMQEAIPRSRLVVIKDAGHLSPLEQPGQVNEAIVAQASRL